MHHEPYGMLVQLTDYIRGLCPALHLADSKLKHPGKKLKQGKPVDCRVRKMTSFIVFFVLIVYLFRCYMWMLTEEDCC